MPGPVPKRDSERRRRNKPEVETVTVEMDEGPVAAPETDEHWHPIARDWYESLNDSGQARFFEPSDWAMARYIAEVMTRNLKGEKFSAVLFAAVVSGMNDLLTSEGARRRARMEIERAPEHAEPAGVTAINAYRKLGL